MRTLLSSLALLILALSSCGKKEKGAMEVGYINVTRQGEIDYSLTMQAKRYIHVLEECDAISKGQLDGLRGVYWVNRKFDADHLLGFYVPDAFDGDKYSIYFNSGEVGHDKDDYAAINNTLVHELGHAMGLDHGKKGIMSYDFWGDAWEGLSQLCDPEYRIALRKAYSLTSENKSECVYHDE